MDGVLYCKTHFEQLFKETGSFSKKFSPGNAAPRRDLQLPQQFCLICRARKENYAESFVV